MKLAHAEYGPARAPMVILLHGFPLDRSTWSPQAAALARHGFRVIVPDLRGHGRTPPGDGPATMEAHAADVFDLADELGIAEFVLGGFSLGGYVALQMVVDRPERIRGLVLADTRADADSEETKKARQDTVAAIGKQGVGVLVERMIPKFFTESTRTHRPALVDDVKAVMLATPPDGAIQALHGMMVRSDQRARLAGIQAPTLVCVGEHDLLTPVDASRFMAAAIPKARLEVIPGAAHLMPLETAELFNEVLSKWILGLKVDAGAATG